MAILGIDEVGRGPLAGPLVFGAVVLPERKKLGGKVGPRNASGGTAKRSNKFEQRVSSDWISELKDSKKLSATKREILSNIIWKKASAVGLGWVSAKEIDQIGMAAALRLAARRAVKAAQADSKKRGTSFSEIVIDGPTNFLSDTALSEYVTVMPKADDLIKEVSAASIVAKVARDAYMQRLAKRYPKYGFERHMGYGTVAHIEALAEYGLCPEHRRSVGPCKKIFEDSVEKRDRAIQERLARRAKASAKNTTAVGQEAEGKVASYLEKLGQEILVRNYKTKYCEIDIVSIDMFEEEIYFTEVKYRKDSAHGGGLAAIDKHKQKQMRFAAECFLAENPKFREYNPLLAVASVMGESFVVQDWFTI